MRTSCEHEREFLLTGDRAERSFSVHGHRPAGREAHRPAYRPWAFATRQRVHPDHPSSAYRGRRRGVGREPVDAGGARDERDVESP